jgi:isopentenyl diphosphate isomerase/L-lactate dehydrogenase-like FMN-dependent dehydrogenase
VTQIETSCTLLGYKMEHPILLAPTSSHLLAHPDAETATARGATAAKAIMVASTVSNRSIEDICKSASEPFWFQLYVEDDRRAVRALIERAEAGGCKLRLIGGPWHYRFDIHAILDKPFLPGACQQCRHRITRRCDKQHCWKPCTESQQGG